MRPNTLFQQRMVKNFQASSVVVYAIPKGLLSYIPTYRSSINVRHTFA
jgi:hypothetical protein